MNKIKTILLSSVLVSCSQVPPPVDVSQEDSGALETFQTVERLEVPVVVDENTRLPKDRPVDVAPLVSNYLAGMLSEYHGESGEAAEYFSEAEGADPRNYYLQEKSFTLQLAMGNVEEAVRLARTLTQMNDALPLAYILLFAQEALHGDKIAARTYLEKAATSSPELLQFQLFRAYLDLSEGKSVDQVVEEIHKFKHHASLAPHKHYHLGRIFEMSGRTEEAMQAYRIAYEQDDSSVFPVARMGQIYAQRGESNMAKALYTEFSRENPDSIMLDQAILALKEDKSIELLQSSLKKSLSEVMFGFATLMGNKHEPLAGDQVLNIVSYIDPNYAYTYFYQGVLSEQMGDFKKSLENYKKITPNQAPYLTTQIRIAQVMAEMGQVDDAIKVMEGWLKKRPDLTVMKRVIAEMYYNAGRYQKAIDAYSLLIDVDDPQSPNAWNYFARGASYERLANYDKAAQDIERSIELRPNNAMALNYLGYMWVEQEQNLEKAFVYISKALLLMPNDAATLDSMGWVLFKMNEFKKSRIFLEKAAEIMPTDSTINGHLGDVYEKLGHIEGARLHWQRALNLEPDTEEMKQHIRRQLQKHKTANK